MTFCIKNDSHIAQVLTYLKLSDCRLGLLMNFNVLRLVDGLKRLANKL
jgi:GxxExxY protein